MDEGTHTMEQEVFKLIKILVKKELDIISPIIFLFIFLMFIDYFSGMLASKKEAIEHPNSKKYGWSRKKSIMGIYKKLGYILTILVASCTDYIIYVFLEKMRIEYHTKTVFGFMVTIWFMVNEIISILENAGRMGVILPQFLRNILSEMKKDIDNYDG